LHLHERLLLERPRLLRRAPQGIVGIVAEGLVVVLAGRRGVELLLGLVAPPIHEPPRQAGDGRGARHDRDRALARHPPASTERAAAAVARSLDRDLGAVPRASPRTVGSLPHAALAGLVLSSRLLFERALRLVLKVCGGELLAQLLGLPAHPLARALDVAPQLLVALRVILFIKLVHRAASLMVRMSVFMLVSAWCGTGSIFWAPFSPFMADRAPAALTTRPTISAATQKAIAVPSASTTAPSSTRKPAYKTAPPTAVAAASFLASCTCTLSSRLASSISCRMSSMESLVKSRMSSFTGRSDVTGVGFISVPPSPRWGSSTACVPSPLSRWVRSRRGSSPGYRGARRCSSRAGCWAAPGRCCPPGTKSPSRHRSPARIASAVTPLRRTEPPPHSLRLHRPSRS